MAKRKYYQKNSLTPEEKRQRAKENFDKAMGRIADALIKRVEKMEASGWKKGWNDGCYSGVPQNLRGRNYSGSNVFLLALDTSDNGYKVPVYLTYLDTQDLGIHVNKGQKGVPVTKYLPYFENKEDPTDRISKEKYDKLSPEEQENYIRRASMRYTTVFNIDQTNLKEVKPELYDKLLGRFTIPELRDEGGMYINAPLDRMFSRQEWLCPVKNDSNRGCYYSPLEDAVHLPEKRNFNISDSQEERYKDGMEYYSSALHEIAHSTGHESRLNRPNHKSWGDAIYAREEVIAEMTAASLGMMMGFDKRVSDNNAAYLKGWIGKLKEKPDFMSKVLHDVDQASYMIMEQVDKQRLALGMQPFLNANKAEQIEDNAQELSEIAEQIKDEKEKVHESLSDDNTEVSMVAEDTKVAKAAFTTDEQVLASIDNLVVDKARTFVYPYRNSPDGEISMSMKNEEGYGFDINIKNDNAGKIIMYPPVFTINDRQAFQIDFENKPQWRAYAEELVNDVLKKNKGLEYKKFPETKETETSDKKLTPQQQSFIDRRKSDIDVALSKLSGMLSERFYNHVDYHDGFGGVVPSYQGIGMPRNMSGRAFSPQNAVFLQMDTARQGFQAPVYGSFLDFGKMGVSINADQKEKAMPILYWDVVIKNKDGHRISKDDYENLGKSAKAKCDVHPYLRTFNTYNIDQTNLKEVNPELYDKFVNSYSALKVQSNTLTPSDSLGMYANAALDDIVKGQKWNVPINVDVMPNDAAYDNASNEIRIADKVLYRQDSTPGETYLSGNYYYSDLLYEMAQSTNRERYDNISNGQNTDMQAMEKLAVANELSSSFIASALGFEKQMQYFNKMNAESLAKTIKEDPKFLVSALAVMNKTSKSMLATIDEQRIANKEKPLLEQDMDMANFKEDSLNETNVASLAKILMESNGLSAEDASKKAKQLLGNKYHNKMDNKKEQDAHRKAEESKKDTEQKTQQARKEQEAKNAAEKQQENNKKQEKEPKVSVPAKVTQAALIIGAMTAAAKEGDGVWLNRDMKPAPSFMSRKPLPITPFNSVVMSLDTDKHGYKTGIYTTWAEAKNNGYPVHHRMGEKAVPFNWVSWEKYQNRWNKDDVITRDAYNALSKEDKMLYKVKPRETTMAIFNVDQTFLDKNKEADYKNLVSMHGGVSENAKEAAINTGTDKAKILIPDLASKMGFHIGSDASTNEIVYDAKSDTIKIGSLGNGGPENDIKQAQDLLRALVDATGSKDRLDRAGKSGLSPEDAAKYDTLVKEVASAALMTRYGLPASLSNEGKQLVPYWDREMKENPNFMKDLERNVNNSIKVIDTLSRGQKVDYAVMRGDKVKSGVAPKTYFVAQAVSKNADIDSKTFVIVKDKEGKTAHVILPKGASIAADNEVQGMRKDRIAKALVKQGFENVKFYNQSGSLSLKMANDEFKNKEVVTATLKQYAIANEKSVNIDSFIKKAENANIISVKAVKDDNKNWTLFIRPENGKFFTITPENKDLDRFFGKGLTKEERAVVQKEVAQKYVTLAKYHPELMTDVVTPKFDKSIDLNRISDVSIVKSKYNPDQKILFAKIDGVQQKPVNVTDEQYSRMFLFTNHGKGEQTDDEKAAMSAYKTQLAGLVLGDLLIDRSQSEAQQQYEAQGQQQEVAVQSQEQEEETAHVGRGM